ncbi:MAG: nitrite/sulfite reductase, partial [Candidatus Tectomicrobia bacterium]|nr:nitrite/sulfite reductase [Candidatus Tectomicrobia bacterium]
MSSMKVQGILCDQMGGIMPVIIETPIENWCKEEITKFNSRGVRGNLYNDFRDLSIDKIVWESDQLAKSHGIYLEYNRAKTGKEKDWMYMMRITIPGGGPINREQYRVLDEIASEYTTNLDGQPSLRVTTRQNIQLHWVKKTHILDIVQRIAEIGFYTLNGCGDNVRNLMGCPLSHFSTLFDAHAWARKAGKYFQLPTAAYIEIFAIDPNFLRDEDTKFDYGETLLNRKFKIAFSTVHFDEEKGTYLPDNCVELRTNDMGIAPLVENGKVERAQVYIGGGQGARHAYTNTFSALGQPFGIFTLENLMNGLDAIVKVHQRYGDRQNRHWARLKHVLKNYGMEWYQQQVRELDAEFEAPNPDHDYGDRHLHHGWQHQPSNGSLSFGAWIENGRIIDGPNGRIKSLFRSIMEKYEIELMTTPNQDVVFVNIPP